ncbi:glycosyltransferase [Paracoccus rhizosphaerae]|uniref:Glycosyltransferase n=1 Tax=Paracoccus rhizosphaerae TaxID=1133347 RepID=A0ABV6CLF1_9RHOB|nr:glycosyltransferase [Paracoccus rhizosphaerae]
MSFLASTKPVDSATAAYLTDQIDQARAIYETLFPTQHLRFTFSAGHDPVWSHPAVYEGPHVPRPSDLGPDYLGSVERPGTSPSAPEVTVQLSIPRQPNPAELKHTEAPWHPMRKLSRLFRASPLIYEHVRYRAEMMRKRQADQRDDKNAMPLNPGSPLISSASAPDSDRRPAILVGMHWLEVGGAEKLGFDTVRWALQAGLRVFVVASVPSLQRLADRLPDHPDVTFIRLDRYLPHHLWPRYVEKLALAENIRLVHIHHCVPLYESLPLLRVRLPWIGTIDSTHIIEYANGGYPRTSGVWSSYLDVQHVISQELVNYFCGTFRISADKVLLGRMLDRDTGADATPDLRLKLGQKTLHVTFIGRLHYQKRPVVVVETLRALQAWATKNDVAFSATMVGDGAFEAAVTRLLRRYGLGSAVTRLPGNTDVPALLQRSDLLLLPSNNEGLALVCYEAITHGCIPISTRVGAQSELLPDDLLVPLAPHASVKATVAVVDRMWRDGGFLERQKTLLARAWARLAADPTAEEALMPIYCKAAGTTPKKD